MENNYWNNKFINKKFIWGTNASESAIMAMGDIKKTIANIKSNLSILDIGCGYGRDVNYFAEENLIAVGIDSSIEAINLGIEEWPNLKLINKNVLGDKLLDEKVDIVFCNFFIHLFSSGDRELIVKKIFEVLNENGVAYFTVSSEKDIDFCNGEKVGYNLVVNSRGVTKFYYNDNTIESEFKLFDKIEYYTFKEKHYHDYEHEHINYFIRCEKAKKG